MNKYYAKKNNVVISLKLLQSLLLTKILNCILALLIISFIIFSFFLLNIDIVARQ